MSRIAEVYRRTRKPKDLLWNRFVARPLAAVVLVPLEHTRITPNQVTLGTLIVFLASMLTIALVPTWGGLLAGVGVLEFAYVLACVDGQLARRLALVAVASASSLTTFLRRPEYAAATGTARQQGTGDYGEGFAAPAAPRGLSPKRAVEALGSLIVHYPSYIVFVALANRIDLFLHAYLLVNAAHVARSLLGITWKLGRSAR